MYCYVGPAASVPKSRVTFNDRLVILLATDVVLVFHSSVSEIPKHAILSVRSSPLSTYLKSEETARAMRVLGLDPGFGRGAQLLLAIALYAEM